jgi:putative transposase
MRFLLRPNNPQTLYVFFVIRHVNREILHVAITPSPTAAWVAQQIVECSAWDCSPPRFLIHDRDSRMARLSIAAFGVSALSRCERRSERPLANAISERWVKSVPTECLDHLLVFNESHLRRAIARTYFNYWRPHRSLGQRAPCESTVHQFRPRAANWKITAEPVLDGLRHIYRRAA